MADKISQFLNRFLVRPDNRQRAASVRQVLESADPVHPKVMVISFDPTVPSQGGQRLSQLVHWNRVEDLVQQAISDLSRASHGYCNFQIVEHITVDAFPLKVDGFSYSADDYLATWRSGQGFHQPDWADYGRILADFQITERVESGQIDEVWLFAFPYGGFYESRMAGPGAFWCNSPPLDGYDHLSRRFVIMGFNFERGAGEILESFGHRAESIMAQVYHQAKGEANLWARFTRHDTSHPGRAEVGTVHFAPNSQRDYDWGNPRRVPSRCDTWLNYPDLSGEPRLVDSGDWGKGDIRLHHLWWFNHFPHVIGQNDGISNNWWQYVIDPNRVPH